MSCCSFTHKNGGKRFRRRTICFTLVLMTVFALIPGQAFGITALKNFYLQDPDTVDVLVVGSSPTRSGINTNVLWEEFGIACYNLNGPEEPYWITYYILQEAIKTQTPKLIILDAKAAIYPDDYCSQIRIITNTFDIASWENRRSAISASLENQEELQAYVDAAWEYQRTGVIQSKILMANDRDSSWKGYYEVDIVDPHERPSFVWNDEKRAINPREEEYVRKIFEMVNGWGIPLLLVAMPNPDYAYDHRYFNTLWEIADEYGIDHINYNDLNMRFGLRYSSNFADWQHLNVKGGIIFTRQFGKDLRERYDLPDRRGDPKYASYDECARIWLEKYPTFESSDPEHQPLDWFSEPAPSPEE